jgi:hypothetical protein
VGPFTIEFLRVTHSMPDASRSRSTRRLARSSTPATSRSIRRRSTANPFDSTGFAELGSSRRPRAVRRQHERRPQGVHRLGGRGHRRLRGDPDRREGQGRRRDVRLEHLPDADPGGSGEAVRRKVAFVGRGVVENTATAQRLGLLNIPPGVQIRDTDVRNYPSQDVLCLCTGSQGEPQAALPRIAINDHRHVNLGNPTMSSCSRPAPSRGTRRRSDGS